MTLLEEARPTGYIQATVERSHGQLEADIAWVARPRDQGRGMATEAARAMIDWLERYSVVRYSAFIHPEHGASGRVAAKLGMHRALATYDGEIRWDYDLRNATS